MKFIINLIKLNFYLLSFIKFNVIVIFMKQVIFYYNNSINNYLVFWFLLDFNFNFNSKFIINFLNFMIIVMIKKKTNQNFYFT